MNPLVSIVIPIYNVGDYIEDCLSSVIAQTYKNLEILCVDDRGTDNSMNIVHRYAQSDSRIKIIQNETNIGLGATRNVGIREASGDYIFFLDSDDYIRFNAIETVVTTAVKFGADIVYGGSEAFPTEQKLINSRYIQELNDKFLKAPTLLTQVSPEQYYFALKSIPCVAWGKLFKTSFIHSNHLFFVEQKVLHEDNGFHIKCLSCQPKIQCLPNRLYLYRIRPESITSEARENILNRLQHLKLSVDDAIKYIQQSGKKELFVSIVKDAYWDIYSHKTNGVTYYFGKNEKRLKLLGINLIKQTSKDGVIFSFSFLGIKIFKYSICEKLSKK